MQYLSQKCSHARYGVSGSNLQAIARAGAGVNNIPLDAMRGEGYRRIQHTRVPMPTVSRSWFLPVCFWHPAILSAVLTGSGNPRRATTEYRKDWQKSRRRTFAGYGDLQARSWVSSVWAPSVSRLPMRQPIWAWKYYGYDPYISVQAAWNLSRSVKHIDAMWKISTKSVIISPSMCRFWIRPDR